MHQHRHHRCSSERPLAGTIGPLREGPSCGEWFEPPRGERDLFTCADASLLSADGTWLLWQRRDGSGWVAADLLCPYMHVDVANWPTHGFHETLTDLVAHLEGARPVSSEIIAHRVEPFWKDVDQRVRTEFYTRCWTLHLREMEGSWTAAVNWRGVPHGGSPRITRPLREWLAQHGLDQGFSERAELEQSLAEAVAVDPPDEFVREAWRLAQPQLGVRAQVGERPDWLAAPGPEAQARDDDFPWP